MALWTSRGQRVSRRSSAKSGSATVSRRWRSGDSRTTRRWMPDGASGFRVRGRTGWRNAVSRTTGRYRMPEIGPKCRLEARRCGVWSPLRRSPPPLFASSQPAADPSNAAGRRAPLRNPPTEGGNPRRRHRFAPGSRFGTLAEGRKPLRKGTAAKPLRDLAEGGNRPLRTAKPSRNPGWLRISRRAPLAWHPRSRSTWAPIRNLG